MKPISSKFRAFFLVTILAALFLGGCAPAKPKVRFVWPPPPEKPRVEYVGIYYSEMSFDQSANQKFLAEMLGASGEYTFRAPFGIASDGKGIVYISDTFDRNVRIYDFNRKKVEFLTKQPVFSIPLGLDIDSHGNLYIADGGAAKVVVYTPDHKPLKVYEQKGVLERPAYLAVNEKLGRLYVSDSKKHHIAVFSLDGKFLFTIGKKGRGKGEFYAPQGLAFSPEGNLYVCDHLNARIQYLTPDGEFLGMFGERGDQPGQFESAKDVAFDSEGHLLALDGRRSELKFYTPDGTLLLTLGEGKATNSQFGFGAPRSVFVDGNDRIYVAENLGRRFAIWQFLSKAYLDRNPWTEADQKALLDYMEKVRKESEKQK
ncbi:MAG: 6-bladed beta-propeller [Geothermobacteraceae bacterium]